MTATPQIFSDAGPQNALNRTSNSASRPSLGGTYTPPSDYEIQECTRIDLLAREGYTAQMAMMDGDMTLRDWWTQAGRRMLGDQWDHEAPEGVTHFVLNKIRPLVVSHAAAQTEQMPTIQFTTVQTGEEPIAVFLKAKAGRKIMRMVQAGVAVLSGFSTAQLQGTDPVTLDQYEVLTEPDPVTFAKPMLKTSDFWVVDDNLIAKAGQALFDLYWERSQGHICFLENEFLCNIFGHQAWLFEIRPQPWSFMFTNPHPCNVFADPNATQIENFTYLLYEQVLDLDRARSMYPEFAPDLERIAAAGNTLGVNTSTSTQIGTQYREMNWQRAMVIVRTCWERNWPFPLTEDEAQQAGKVSLAPWPAGEAVRAGVLQSMADPGAMPNGQTYNEPAPASPDPNAGFSDPATPGVNDGTGAASDMGVGGVGSPEVSPASPGPGLGDVAAGPTPTHRLTGTGQPVDPTHPAWPQRYVLPNGEPVDPTDGAWPKRYGIMQTVMIRDINRIISQQECQFEDIQWSWNKNEPIQFSPYGVGTPVMMEKPQQLINRQHSTVFNNIRFHGNPQEYYPNDLLDELLSKKIEPHARPNNIIGITTEMYRKYFIDGKRTSFAMEAPQLPESLPGIMAQTLKVFDDVAGNVDVMQGQPPDAGMSGTALAQLTANAKGPLAFKSQFSEAALTRMAWLAFNAMLKFLPESEWQRYMRVYPPAVFGVLQKQIKCADWNVKVELVSGKGANKQISRTQTLEEYATVPPLLTKRTAREKLGIDPDIEERREEEQQEEAEQEQMRLSMMAPPPGPGGPPGGGQPPQPQPGKMSPQAPQMAVPQQ